MSMFRRLLTGASPPTGSGSSRRSGGAPRRRKRSSSSQSRSRPQSNRRKRGQGHGRSNGSTQRKKTTNATRTKKPHAGGASKGGIIAYHGTPSAQNARSVFQHGWITGSGNAYGDGIYLATDIATAKAYAGNSGVYLKCRVRAGKCAKWGPELDRQFCEWSRRRNVPPDNSAKTAFLIQNGYHTLRHGKIVVVLQPQYANPSAWKQRTNRIHVMSVHDARGRRIRV